MLEIISTETLQSGSNFRPKSKSPISMQILESLLLPVVDLTRALAAQTSDAWNHFSSSWKCKWELYLVSDLVIWIKIFLNTDDIIVDSNAI